MKQRIRRLLLFIPGLTAVFGGFPGRLDAVSTVFPLQIAIEEARKKNPEILAARAYAAAAKARILAEISIPAPEFVSEDWIVGGPADVPRRMVGITQHIPFPTKIVSRVDKASHEARRLAFLAADKEREVLARVKEIYAEWSFKYQTLLLNRENLEVLNRLGKATVTKYKLGKAFQSEFFKAQVEQSKMEVTLLNLEQEKETARVALYSILDRLPGENQEDPQVMSALSVTRTAESLESGALQSPGFLALKEQILIMQSEAGLTGQGYFPDMGFKYTTPLATPFRNSLFTFSVDLPFLWFWKPWAEAEAGRQGVLAAEHRLRAEKAFIHYKTREILTRVQTAQRRVELYHISVLPRAEQAFRVGEVAYQTDKIKFFNLLDNQRILLDFKIEYQQALLDLAKAAAEMERVAGTINDQN